MSTELSPNALSGTVRAPALHSHTVIVHTEYDISAPPPLPGPEWTRFVCISDTHSRQFAVPEGDVLLHSGDLTNSGTYKGFRSTIEWLADLPHPHKIIIAGNHDLPLDQNDDWYEKNWERWHWPEKEVRLRVNNVTLNTCTCSQDVSMIKELLQGELATSANILYLEDQQHEFRVKEGGRLWSVYGSPWSPDFYNWAFNYERSLQAEKIVSSIPKTDILLTHGPPFGILDETITHEQVGCETLAMRLATTLRPRLHVFGHIHEAHGALIQEWDADGQGRAHGERTVFVNAANWPMGSRARPAPGESRIQFGERPFQPVIVDLLD
ncbi:Metallo-dependent phosphatase-like protein [Sparassis latifolia]